MIHISKTLKKVLLLLVFLIVFLLISGYTYLYVLPKGPDLTETRSLKSESDSFVMYAYKNSQRKSIRVWTYKPEAWKNEDKILFVMHGGGRNADDYLEAWKQIAEEHKILIVAPEFENKFSRYTTNDYQEGNLITFFGVKNPKEEWAYTVIENIFDYIKAYNNITNNTYDIFGHSAGGQFVHRMLILMPEARIDNAIAANAGFYTFPNENLEYPYGMKNTSSSINDKLREAFKKNLIILLGENDNDPKLGTFRTTEPAMEQGRNRLERGSNFFKKASQLAVEKSWQFNWKIDTVLKVGHDYKKMSANAVKYISR